MSKNDRDRADARFNKARAGNDAKAGRAGHDATTKAVLDNMARLKALRLAREAAEPPRAPAAKKASAKSEEAGRKNPGAVGLAGGPAKRRPKDLAVLTVCHAELDGVHRLEMSRALLGRLSMPSCVSQVDLILEERHAVAISNAMEAILAISRSRRQPWRYTGAGHCTSERVLVAASYT